MARFFSSYAGYAPSPLDTITRWEASAGRNKPTLVCIAEKATDGRAVVHLKEATVLLHKGSAGTFWGITTPAAVETAIKAGDRLRAAATTVEGVSVFRSSSGGDDCAIVVIPPEAPPIGIILSGYDGRSNNGVAWLRDGRWEWEGVVDVKLRLL